jgi:hypothetical protein
MMTPQRRSIRHVCQVLNDLSEKTRGKKLAPRTARTKTLEWNKQQPDILVIQWDLNNINAKFIFEQYGGFRFVMGVPPVLILFFLGFSWIFHMKTIQLG